MTCVRLMYTVNYHSTTISISIIVVVIIVVSVIIVDLFSTFCESGATLFLVILMFSHVFPFLSTSGISLKQLEQKRHTVNYHTTNISIIIVVVVLLSASLLS